MEPISRPVEVTRPAARASGLARMEARRLGHHSAPSLLGGLLVEATTWPRCSWPTAWTWTPSGPGSTGWSPRASSPAQPSDGELLASLGVDLQAVHTRLQATFGEHAYWDTAQDPAPGRPARPHTPRPHRPDAAGVRARMGFAAHEAIDRDQEVGPEHLLYGLLREAEAHRHRPAGPVAP